MEGRIAETYVKKAGKITNKNSLYDSYIKSFRWASDNLGNQGVIAFITNAGWLDSASACGVRRCLQEEFSSIYIYHLKGNQRTSGEQSRREGGKIFGSGSRSPIAITFLVKNPHANAMGKIYFGCVDDYLSREDNLNHLSALGSIYRANLTELTQDEHGDWFSLRNDDFTNLISMNGKSQDKGIFSQYSRGVVTGRDAWSFNASKAVLRTNFSRCINLYNAQVDEASKLGETFKRNNDSTQIKWNSTLAKALNKHKFCAPFTDKYIVTALYRPFFKEFFYSDKA